jgi:hypothetical protein
VHALVAGLHYSGHARIEPMLFAVHHVAQNTFSYTTNNVLLEYDLSSGITMGSAATSSGWSASVSHSEMGTGEGCVVFYGNAATATVGSTTSVSQGEVACTR